jgi:beta-mannosidase
MERISLNGKWLLSEREQIKDDICCLEESTGNLVWMVSQVPGDVNQTLLEHGKIPNPHYNDQARESYWVTSKEWWYKLEFNVLKGYVNSNVDLCLDRVDGVTDIWLNGSYLGETKNAFRVHRFAIKGLLKDKSNILIIRFKSIDQLLGGPRIPGPRMHENAWQGRGAFLRQPQYSFGWDWALSNPSIGLSGDVWLEINSEYRLKNVSIQPFVTGRVDFEFEVTKDVKEAGYKIVLNVFGHGVKLEKEITRNTYKSYTSIFIEEPKLWFPNGNGEPALYNYSICLFINNTIVDTYEGKLGIRESEIVEEPFTEDGGEGFSFWLKINREKIFCKGANWVPLEIWPVNAKPEQYEYYLKMAKEANFNMLRVWGGGIYEKDIFYNLCDELGIMIWEDFMFASSGYPVDLLREEIIKEADYQIKRLRNHPSIVIWCGCNEDVYSWSWPEEQEDNSLQIDFTDTKTDDFNWEVNRYKDDPQIYTMILRGLVGKYGLGVPYIESSPQSRDDAGNAPNSGNSHISCWKYALFNSDGKPRNFRKHFEIVCSFDSEFCIQGPCSEKSFKKFMSPSNLWPPNETWVFHVQKGHANIPHHEQTLFIAGDVFGEIDSLQKYVKHGQATHIEMMRAEYESARRDYPNNGGTMVWMFNDCWPTANWSIIDYYKNPKPSYYAAKRSCSPLLPIVFERCGYLEFLFSNHTAKNIEVYLKYGRETLDGKTIWEKESTVKTKANSAVIFDKLNLNEAVCTPDDFFYIDAEINEKPLPRVIYFPKGWKDIKWPSSPSINLEIQDKKCVNNTFETNIKITTDKFLRLFHIRYIGDKEENLLFSDNYFDLSAKSKRTVTLYSKHLLDLKDLEVGHWLTPWE